MKHCLWKSLGAAVFLVCGAREFALAADSTAGATDAGPAAPPQQSGPVVDELETITVTAEKIKEDVNKTPLAISVFSGTAMQEQGVVSIADLQNIDPELNVGMSPAGVNISLRGIATTDVTSKGNQDIAFNVDGIFNGRPREQALSFFDLDRVEVLRGPQGTLYGHSATGGAINVITNRPTDEFDASGSAEIGNFNARRGMGVLNVPLIGATLDVRVAVNYNVRDGYLNPVLGNTFTVSNTARPVDDENNRAARVSALWKPADSVSLLLTENTGYIGGTGSDYGALYDRYSGTGSAARDVYYNPMGGAINDSFHNFNAELNADLGPVHLTYDGAHDHYVAHDSDDESTGDPTASGSYTWRNYMGDYTTDSHELRFSNVNPGFMDWVFGGNYFKEYLMEHDQNWATYVDANPANNCNATAPNLLYGCNSPNPSIEGPSQHKGEGVFGQVNLHLTDALKATFGARYSHDSMFRHATVDGGGAQPLSCFPPNDCVNGGEPDVGSESASKVTWRVGLDYQLTDAQMVYGYVATGYKPGGFNDPAQGQTTTTTYGPEELTAYEIGYKGEIAPSLQLNSDAYYYDFQKEQITAASYFGFGTAGPIILIYTKLAPAKFYGLENSLHWRPTKADLVDASLSYERAYYGNLQVGFIASLPVDWTGKSLDNTPRNSGTLGYEHRFFMTDGGYINARLQFKYSSSYYESDLAGSGVVSPVPGASYYDPAPAQYTQSAYTRTDFTLGYTAASGKYDVYGFIRNIEDKMQLAGAPQNLLYRSDPNAVWVNVTAPRTFGMHFDVRL